jgi:hypothetical protein
MQISLLEVAGFQSAFKAMRLPMKSGEKSDSYLWFHEYCDEKTEYYETYGFTNNQTFTIGRNDLALAQSLILKGDEHAKFIRGIEVWLELSAPWYWFNELDTYTIGTSPIGSTSSMHTECRHLTGEALQATKGDIRGNYEYTRIRTFNYQTLRRIYYQRLNHRLPEWKQFIEFILTLPLAKELICVEK